jgi:hypothetical protein
MGENPIWSRLEPEGLDPADRPQDDDELPAHERDERRRGREEGLGGSDPAAKAGLPEHEQDSRRAGDTGGGGQPSNP